MKRSPTCSSGPCSSSSSCADSGATVVPHEGKPEKKKRVRKNHKSQKCNSPPSSGNGRRSSIYRGVTRHRWTGRFEAHLWDKSSWNSIQNKKGRQVYLGAYDCEQAAAHTYDLAALKYWGPETTLNFPIGTYEKEREEMEKMSKEEYLASLRRRSSGFSRGVSKYRGVARHHHNGRWEARIGRVLGNKYLYLGTYNTQEEAAAAYDMAAIEHRGANAVTNFDISNYIGLLKNKGDLPADEPADQETLPNNSTESDEVELEVEQPQHQQQQHENQVLMPQVQPDPQFSPSILDSTAVPDMDPSEMQDPHWNNFFSDTGFPPLPLPNLPFEKSGGELLDWFNDTGFEENIDTGFEDNIDIIFDDIDFIRPDCTMNMSCGETNNVAGGGMEEDNGQEGMSLLLSCPTTSSPTSTTTSGSCNYSG